MKTAGKLLLVTLAGGLLLAGCGQKTTYKPGTYEAEGQGYDKEKPIRLSVTIDESEKIYEIRILDQQETPDIGGKALDKLKEKAIEENRPDVDTISGATRTSEGFRDAVRAALNQAKEAAKNEPKEGESESASESE